MDPLGGTGTYVNYKIKLFSSNGTLKYESQYQEAKEFTLSGVVNGTYYVEYEVIDSEGNVGTGESSLYTLST